MIEINVSLFYLVTGDFGVSPDVSVSRKENKILSVFPNAIGAF